MPVSAAISAPSPSWRVAPRRPPPGPRCSTVWPWKPIAATSAAAIACAARKGRHRRRLGAGERLFRLREERGLGALEAPRARRLQRAAEEGGRCRRDRARASTARRRRCASRRCRGRRCRRCRRGRCRSSGRGSRAWAYPVARLLRKASRPVFIARRRTRRARPRGALDAPSSRGLATRAVLGHVPGLSPAPWGSLRGRRGRAAVAQLVRASDCGSEGRRFEPAQLLPFPARSTAVRHYPLIRMGSAPRVLRFRAAHAAL